MKQTSRSCAADLERQLLEAKIAAIRDRKRIDSMQRFMNNYVIRDDQGRESTLGELYAFSIRVQENGECCAECGKSLQECGSIVAIHPDILPTCPYCDIERIYRKKLEAMG